MYARFDALFWVFTKSRASKRETQRYLADWIASINQSIDRPMDEGINWLVNLINQAINLRSERSSNGRPNLSKPQPMINQSINRITYLRIRESILHAHDDRRRSGWELRRLRHRHGRRISRLDTLLIRRIASPRGHIQIRQLLLQVLRQGAVQQLKLRGIIRRRRLRHVISVAAADTAPFAGPSGTMPRGGLGGAGVAQTTVEAGTGRAAPPAARPPRREWTPARPSRVPWRADRAGATTRWLPGHAAHRRRRIRASIPREASGSRRGDRPIRSRPSSCRTPGRKSEGVYGDGQTWLSYWHRKNKKKKKKTSSNGGGGTTNTVQWTTVIHFRPFVLMKKMMRNTWGHRSGNSASTASSGRKSRRTREPRPSWPPVMARLGPTCPGSKRRRDGSWRT